jgi:hypothetical protein
MNASKEAFKTDAKIVGVPDSEVDFRYAGFEAIMLAYSGKQKEAEEKLKEMEEFYKNI